MVIVPTVYVMNWFRLRTTGWSCMGAFYSVDGDRLLNVCFAIHRLFEHRHRAVGAVSRKAGITLAISMQESGLLNGDGADESLDVGSVVFTEYSAEPVAVYQKSSQGQSGCYKCILRSSALFLRAFFS